MRNTALMGRLLLIHEELLGEVENHVSGTDVPRGRFGSIHVWDHDNRVTADKTGQHPGSSESQKTEAAAKQPPTRRTCFTPDEDVGADLPQRPQTSGTTCT